MNHKEKTMVEKTVIEEDLQDLENEIDAAVDRLFVEKGGGPLRGAPSSPPIQETFMEPKPAVEWEMPPSAPVAFDSLPTFEKLETQLLSLEWEINRENLRKTAQEVIELKKEFQRSPDLFSILDRMLTVINFMIRHEENIQPYRIQILLDSKETMKLLMRDETDEQIGTYKRLALAGLEARFGSLEEIKGVSPHPVYGGTQERGDRAEVFSAGSEWMEKITEHMESFSNKLDRMLETLNRHSAAHEKFIQPPGPPVTASAPSTPSKAKVTVFKVGEKLLAIESHQVFKLFKVPASLRKTIQAFPKFRLQGFEVKMIDVETLFSIPESEREVERLILILKGNGTYKGLLIDRILNRLSAPMEEGETFDAHLLGMIRWTYQDLPIRIPILNLERL